MTEEKQTPPPKQIKEPESMRGALRAVDNMQEMAVREPEPMNGALREIRRAQVTGKKDPNEISK